MSRSTFVLRCLVGLLLLIAFGTSNCLAALSANLPGDWTTYGNNPAHTGYFPGTLGGLKFVEKWKVPMPASSIKEPAIGGGRVFVTAGWYYGNMYLISLDSETGQPLRTNNFGSWYSINPPTYADGSVYVQRVESSSSQISQMVSFDAATLATNWATTFASQGSYYLSPVVVDGTVYADTGYYVELTAYNRTNGALRFSVPLIGNGCDEWTPAYSGGKVYTWVNGFFSEHNPTTGSRNWTLTNATQGEFIYSMERTLAIAGGRAYFTSKTKLMAVNLSTHLNLWETSGNYSGTPTVANGIVYTISNSVVTAHTTNGVFVRNYNTATSTEKLLDQLIVTDDVLIAAGGYGVYVFRLADGVIQQLISSYHTPCYCYTSSKISLANNTLYVASGDGNVYAHTASNLLQFVVGSMGAQYGTPTPNPYGTNYVIDGSTVTNTVASPVSGPASTRYVVTGWTGTGSVPAGGNTNTVTFIATTNSTLTWQIRTQYFLQTSVSGPGTVNIPTSWQDGGTNISITATANLYYHLTNWGGDVTGTSNVLTFSMDGPRSVVAYFVANLVTNSVPEWWLAQYGLPVSDAGAMADTDADGFTAWQEYRAGTNPTNSASFLQLTAILDPTRLILRWPSASGRKYRVLRATDLGTGFSPLATNISGGSSFTTYNLNNPVPSPSYYRIQVE